jgi:hypothetical protein
VLPGKGGFKPMMHLVPNVLPIAQSILDERNFIPGEEIEISWASGVTSLTITSETIRGENRLFGPRRLIPMNLANYSCSANVPEPMESVW